MNKRSHSPSSSSSFRLFEKSLESNSLRKTGQLLLVMGVLLSTGFVVGRNQATETNVKNKSDVPSTVAKSGILPVSTVKIEPVSSYQRTQAYTGQVAALRTSQVGFERGGKIVAVGVDEGDLVQQGQTIAQLDTATLQAQRQGLVAQKAQAQAILAELNNGARTEQVASAQARVQDLQQQLELAKIRNSRREYLYREGAISQEQLDEVAFNRQALQKRLEAAQSNLAELENGTRIEKITAQKSAVDILIAKIAELDIQINKSILKAPFDGIVASRNFDEGTVIEAGQSVLRLVEKNQLEVRIGIPVDAARSRNVATRSLSIGSSQKVSINGNEYKAIVDSFLPEIDFDTRTKTVILTLDPQANQEVSPGEIARLSLTRTEKIAGYWLPIAAVQKSDRGLWSCYSVVTNEVGETVVEKQYLEVLATEDNRVLVKGTIEPGDLIVANGIHRLVPQQRVINNR